MIPSPCIKLPRSHCLVVLSDAHIGHQDFDERHFDEAIKWCIDSEAMIALGGDILENTSITGTNVGDKLLEQVHWPTEQFKLAVAKLTPLKKKGRIALVLTGNHEARSRREALLDLSELLAHALGAPYLRVGGYVRFLAGDKLYLAGMQHGRSNAINTFLELDRMLRIYPRADFVTLGHNHDLAHRRIMHLEVAADGTEVTRVRHQIRTGTYLRFASYARNLCLPPSLVGSPVITMSPRSYGVSVDLTTLAWA